MVVMGDDAMEGELDGEDDDEATVETDDGTGEEADQAVTETERVCSFVFVVPHSWDYSEKKLCDTSDMNWLCTNDVKWVLWPEKRARSSMQSG